MKKNRRVFSSEFKSKVVLESLKERETLASLAKKFEIHPQQITDWKQRFLSGLRDFFGEGRSTEKSESEQEQLVSGLYEKIGRLEVENEFLKKVEADIAMEVRKSWVDGSLKALSILRQCELLSLGRSRYYYSPIGESSLNLELMLVIDKHFLEYPFKGIRKMCVYLQSEGYTVNPKRVRRLYKLMGLRTLYCEPKTTKIDKAAYKYPYLLRGLAIERSNQVWEIDITYLPMQRGFLYLVAIVDVYSRFVVDWDLSNSMTAEWVTACVKNAVNRYEKPEILNSDQGVQFTSEVYTSYLTNAGIRISMDGKGRALDNIFIERLWRTVKYEHVYIRPADDGLACYQGLENYFLFYNESRHHQALDYITPKEVYRADKN